MLDNNIVEIDKKKKRAQRILSTVYTLPTVPYIIYEVNRVIDNPMASAAQLGKIINQDQGLVTKILSVANSPLYGIPRRVSTIDFAVVILGFNHIKNIVIALSMMEAFKSIGDHKFPRKKYWFHSILTATAAKRIADDLGFPYGGEAFTAGLLHDLGLPVIYKYFPQDYQHIIDAVRYKQMTFEEAELEYIGMTHQEMGRFLMDKWNLPSNLAEVVEYHHNPSLSKEHLVLTSLVHLADYMTQKLQIGSFYWDYKYGFDKSVIETLKLGNEEYLENFILSYRELFKNQLESINI
ncbi:MAG: HDOD domain-containing protein [bacterium]